MNLSNTAFRITIRKRSGLTLRYKRNKSSSLDFLYKKNFDEWQGNAKILLLSIVSFDSEFVQQRRTGSY